MAKPYTLRNAKKENFVFSLSRWTDLPAAKWDWFKERLAQGQMIGTCPRTGVPDLYSLHPDDTLGMVFWTRDSRNLIKDADLLKDYKKMIHFTLTGWHEVEHKAPRIEEGLEILRQTVNTFGADSVIWRFSPVPVVDDALDRFTRIATEVTKMGIKEVYVAFLQTNDSLEEPRDVEERAALLREMAQAAPDLQVKLCNEDDTLRKAKPVETHFQKAFKEKVQIEEKGPQYSQGIQVPTVLSAFWFDFSSEDLRVLADAREKDEKYNLSYGVCEDSKPFTDNPETEGCGCAKAVDPFGPNETCRFGCEYCYAADNSLAPKKRSTTKATRRTSKSLPVVS